MGKLKVWRAQELVEATPEQIEAVSPDDHAAILQAGLACAVFSGDNEPLPVASEPVRSADLERLIDQHRNALKIWEELENAGYAAEKPRFPKQLAVLLLRLAEKFARRPNWRNYRWIEDGQQDALLTCLLYWNNFDPSKGRAVQYFGRIVWSAFTKRLNREARQDRIVELATKALIDSENTPRRARVRAA